MYQLIKLLRFGYQSGMIVRNQIF